MTSLQPRLALAFTWGTLVTIAIGCERHPSSFDRFIPEPSIARHSLNTALEAWLAERPGKEPLGRNPKIQFVDRRRESLRLTEFEVLGEVITEGARGFAVRLKFADSEEALITRYFVVGIDPLWVFRQEDFETIMHWMNDMKEPGDDKVKADPKP